ncbi:MAG: CBS domain-containing protein [Myxococcaceae bacterium]
MKVEQLMMRPVWTCQPSDSLNVAAQLMWEKDVGCVVVQAQGKVVGVVTDRDVCMGAYTTGRSLSAISVREAMAKEPVLIQPHATIEAAERTMQERRIRRLPVVDEQGLLVGLLALNDIAREARRQHGKRRPEVNAAGVAGTLAALCEPRSTEALVSVKRR